MPLPVRRKVWVCSMQTHCEILIRKPKGKKRTVAGHD